MTPWPRVGSSASAGLAAGGARSFAALERQRAARQRQLADELGGPGERLCRRAADLHDAAADAHTRIARLLEACPTSGRPRRR